MSSTAKFCSQCGSPLKPVANDPRFASPTSYTPLHLADKIRAARATLEGERKQVTVLFADIKGSMELFANRDREAAQKIFDPVLERMIEAVHHYEGTVNRVIGDGIMALFGAPIAHEDHAVRACYAALRMQETVKQYAEELQRTQGMGVMIRVGLTRGRSSSAASATICTWNTPSWARRRTWPLVWNKWQSRVPCLRRPILSNWRKATSPWSPLASCR